MNQFSANKGEIATVPFPRSQVWGVLTDPDLVAQLTPMVKSIQARDEDTWVWNLRSIPVVGVAIEPRFAVRMHFDPERRITYAPASGADEETRVTGEYQLTEKGAHATELSIDLRIEVDLPLPKISRPVVQSVMQATLATMGVGFARSLDRELRRRS